VRRVRRELEAAREQLRRELGAEPTLSDLARRVGTDEAQLERPIVRISTIESTSPLANLETLDSSTLPAVLVPSEPISPDRLFERNQTRDRIRGALVQLPARERRILSLYYFGDATMKQIGQEIGVNESRVSQLHARAIQRLRRLLSSSDAVARPRLVRKTTGRPLPKKTLRPAATALPARNPRVPEERRAVA
jgi:RNA polymerase sigma factor for flagellar operon FliA